MSKFCGVISSKSKYLDLTPLLFQHLEVITEWLLNETIEIYREYEIKQEAMLEQQEQMRENEENLLDMHAFIEKLKTSVLTLELEVQDNDEVMQKLERNVCVLENQSTDMCMNCDYRGSPHENMLQLLLNTDNVIQQLNILMEQNSKYEQQLQAETNPYKIIFAILDNHLQAIEIMERNLNTLDEKLHFVDIGFLEVADKIGKCRQFSQPTIISSHECQQ